MIYLRRRISDTLAIACLFLGRDLAAICIFIGNMATGPLSHALCMLHEGIMFIVILLKTVPRGYRPVSSPCKCSTIVSSSSRSNREVSLSRTPRHAVFNRKPDRNTRVIAFVSISIAHHLASLLLFQTSCLLCPTACFGLLLFRRPFLRAGAS